MRPFSLIAAIRSPQLAAMRIIGALALLGAAACTPSKPPASRPLNWNTFEEDGSLIGVAHYAGPEDMGGVMRCWKVGAEYDCLTVMDGEWREALRQKRRVLPQTLPSPLELATARPGYRCSIKRSESGHNEEILGDNGRLTSHVATSQGSTEPEWTREYVETYMRTNGNKPKALYFNCPLLDSIAAKGSVYSILITGLTYGALTQ